MARTAVLSRGPDWQDPASSARVAGEWRAPGFARDRPASPFAAGLSCSACLRQGPVPPGLEDAAVGTASYRRSTAVKAGGALEPGAPPAGQGAGGKDPGRIWVAAEGSTVRHGSRRPPVSTRRGRVPALTHRASETQCVKGTPKFLTSILCSLQVEMMIIKTYLDA